MLRTLPKVLRRQVVPAAEWAARISAELPEGPERGAQRDAFAAALGQTIRKLTFAPVDPSDFDVERVPPAPAGDLPRGRRARPRARRVEGPRGVAGAAGRKGGQRGRLDLRRHRGRGWRADVPWCGPVAVRSRNRALRHPRGRRIRRSPSGPASPRGNGTSCPSTSTPARPAMSSARTPRSSTMAHRWPSGSSRRPRSGIAPRVAASAACWCSPRRRPSPTCRSTSRTTRSCSSPPATIRARARCSTTASRRASTPSCALATPTGCCARAPTSRRCATRSRRTSWTACSRPSRSSPASSRRRARPTGRSRRPRAST